MIYLDISVHDFIKKNPQFLELSVPCGCKKVRPFVTKKSIGLICENCHSSVWTRKDDSLNDTIMATLNKRPK